MPGSNPDDPMFHEDREYLTCPRGQLLFDTRGDRLMAISPCKGKVRWQVRVGTDIGPPPIALRTSPAPGSRQKPEELAILGTMDGLLAAFRMKNGNLAWKARAASRLTRPIALWIDPSDRGADRTRLIVAGEGSRRVELFRAIDGAPAGSHVLEPADAIILAGPIAAGGRCYIAWSLYPPAGSSILSLSLSGMP